MKRLLILALLPITLWANPRVYSDKEFKKERDKVQTALSLHLMIPDKDWTVFVIPEDNWKGGLTKQLLRRSNGSCYTLLVSKTTYCNASWVKRADIMEIARTLAHEYGHIFCNCAEENMAEAYVVAVR